MWHAREGPCSNRSRSTLVVVVSLLLLATAVCRGERHYEELPWSSELCAELGYDAEFDVCGVIEFCVGGDSQTRRQRRNLRRHKSDHDFHAAKKNVIKCGGENEKTKAKTHERSQYYYSHQSGMQNYSISDKDLATTTTTTTTSSSAKMDDMEGMDMSEEEPTTMSDSNSTEDIGVAPEMKMSAMEHAMMNSTDGDEQDDEEQGDDEEEDEEDEEANWSATNEQVFSEEVKEEKEKFQKSHSNSSATEDFDLESWLASNLPVASLLDPINKAEFGWRLPGSSHCSWPGPLIRLKPGQRHGLLVKGAPGTKTNIRFHGLHIAGHGNGDNMMRIVDGNDVLVYSLDIPENHMGGTHWYHSQLHGESQRQVGGGAFGLLIVDDGSDIGTTDPNVLAFMQREQLLVLDNRKSNRWIANGMEKTKEIFQLRNNEWYRMRILTVNTDVYTSGETLRFGESCDVHAVAHDGMLRFQVPNVTASSEFLLSSASRLDVAIRCTSSSTISVGSQQVATIQVQDTDEDPSPATPFEAKDQPWSSTRPPYLANLRELPVDNSWKLHIDEVDLNHQSWYAMHPLCDDKGNDFVYDSVQEWSVTGLESQPLHVHTYPMQVVSDDGCGSGHDVGEFYDTISAHGSMEVSRNCKVRLRLTDVAGPTVLQSHALQHSDQGSIGILHVVGGPQQPDEPHVFRCSNPETCDEPESIITCSDW